MAPLVWLVTGCSSGFGEQFVHNILARGDKVIATGRNAATRLQHLGATGAAILDLDVSISQAELNEKVEEALKIYGRIDVLVNNAGYIESAPVEELGHERLLKSLHTNLFGPVNLCRAISPHFRSKRSGSLVFIGSQAGWKGDPGAAAYCAGKFAQEGIVECLQQEMPMFGVKTIIFEPGYFRTQALSQKNIKHEPSTLTDYAEFYEMSIAYEKTAFGNEPGDPKKAVERMIDVIKGEGQAQGRPMPPRLPLGSDGLKVMREKCLATLKLCDEWEEFIVSTDISG
ncbi:MAG: hypothetical protein M1818_004746 [Claussenomyces sp. TS43310]|nr:MAG: hypothetical protein M1818_004746 [Claussenomyces sp. TS43310]